MTTQSDLLQLERPAIDGLVLSVDAVHAEILTWLRDRQDWTVTQDASDPAWRLTRLLAGRESLLRQRIADAVAGVSLPWARGEMLDHIGLTYYRLPRLQAESDAAYIERLQAAPELYAVGLSGPWYEQTARGVTGVADARFTNPAAGTGKIYILANAALLDAMRQPLYAAGIPDATLLAAVLAAVTADSDRQQTDTITVHACTRQRYDVGVVLDVLPEADVDAVLAAARASLRRLALRTDRLGRGLDNTLVAGATVDPAAASGATIQISTVAANDTTTAVTKIAASDSVAPQARNLTVSAS